MAYGMKVWFQWDNDFYPGLQSTGNVVTGGEDVPLYFDAVWGKPTQSHIMCLFHVGPSQSFVQPYRTNDEIVENSLQELEQIFDNRNLESSLFQSMVQNWSQEPYIRGAYIWNYGYYDHATLRRPMMDGHLFLAGEHITVGDDYTGTVHGAAITGRVAVIQILHTIPKER